MDKSNIDLSVLIQHFEVHNKTEGKSVRTVEWYNQALTMFQEWLKDQGMPTTIGSLGEAEARGFVLYLQGRPGLWGAASTHTIANRVRALRAFFAWLDRKGYTEGHVLKDLKPPKVLQQVIEPLTEEEVSRMFDAINSNTALGARNAALFSVMLDSGLRLSEVATLKEDDVHLEDRYVKVCGKGSKERVVSFGVACQRAMLHYYHHFRPTPVHPGIETFFLSIDGYSLSSDAVRSLTERLSKACGVRRLHPHLLRHTYATCFLLNGGDVFLLKQNLGHSTLAMVEHYVHIASQRAAIRSQGFSPLDRFEVKDSRRFRHSFGGNGTFQGVYPHAGKAYSNGRSGAARKRRASA